MNDDDDTYEDLDLSDIESRPKDAPLSAAARYLGLGMLTWAIEGSDLKRARYLVIRHLPALLGRSEKAVCRLAAPRVRSAVTRGRTATRNGFCTSLRRFEKRVAPLADKLRLTTAAKSILFLSYLIRSEPPLKRVADAIALKHRTQAAEVMKAMFSGELKPWRQLLGGDSPLIESGLLNRSHLNDASDVDDVAMAVIDLTEAIESDTPISTLLLESAVRVLDGPSLALAQFRHLKTDLDIVLGLINAPNGNTQILLAGPPGVGKTQFVRALSVRLGRQVYEVKSEDESGDPCGRTERFQHYVLAQKLLTAPERCLLLFDEAEDVFTGDHWAHLASQNERHKGWTNRVLESALVPTIWISNSIERIDPAYLRRFDHVVQMDVPPQSVRRGMLERALAGHGVSATFMDRVAESGNLSPADIDRTARALSRLTESKVLKDELAGRILTARPNGVPRAMVAARRDQTRFPYRLEWINCDLDLPAVIENLRTRGHGTLGFFGPPGTGKTELARHIARSLDRPLHLKRVSDLMDCYLGQTEKNIAGAFEQAAEDGAVLFLDEADSFLQDRARASRSWEITQVNELLAQLDGYNGIALLASNFVDNLDAALMRRLDVKATFNYLKPATVVEVCRAMLGNTAPESVSGSESLHRLGTLDLSFGDFAAAARGLELRGGIRDVETLTDALHRELRTRKGASRSIGF